MKNKRKLICDQLTEADKEFENFLDKAGISALALKQANAFIKKFNALKKAAADFDTFITPVEIEIQFPFHTKELTEMWERWKKYLSEQHGEIMRTCSEQSSLEHLNVISKGDEAKAVYFLRYAMSCRYRNFFAVDEKTSTQPAKGDGGSGSAFDDK